LDRIPELLGEIERLHISLDNHERWAQNRTMAKLVYRLPSFIRTRVTAGPGWAEVDR